jgi:hypothetical protein
MAVKNCLHSSVARSKGVFSQIISEKIHGRQQPGILPCKKYPDPSINSSLSVDHGVDMMLSIKFKSIVLI